MKWHYFCLRYKLAWSFFVILMHRLDCFGKNIWLLNCYSGSRLTVSYVVILMHRLDCFWKKYLTFELFFRLQTHCFIRCAIRFCMIMVFRILKLKIIWASKLVTSNELTHSQNCCTTRKNYEAHWELHFRFRSHFSRSLPLHFSRLIDFTLHRAILKLLVVLYLISLVMNPHITQKVNLSKPYVHLNRY